MKAYPVPSQHRWAVAVEFPDGDRIEGASDTDVLERWAKRAAWLQADGPIPTVRELKRSIARRAIRLDEVEAVMAQRRGINPSGADRASLPWDGPDDLFLDAGMDRGYWWVIRK